MFVHRLGLEFCTKWCVQDVWSVLLVLQKGVCLIFSHQQKFVCDEVALEMIVLNPVSCLFSVCDIPSDPPSLCFVTEVEVWLFCVSVTWMNNDSLGFFVIFFAQVTSFPICARNDCAAWVSTGHLSVQSDSVLCFRDEGSRSAASWGLCCAVAFSFHLCS